MFNRTTDAKAFATAACTLAVALLIIGMTVNSSWACARDSDCPAGYICQGINEKVCTKK